MTSGSDKNGKGEPVDPADADRLAEALNPLANSAAVMAAATAFGFGMAAQMSRLFLGSLQGAMDVTGNIARQLEEERKAAEATAPTPQPMAHPQAAVALKAAKTKTETVAPAVVVKRAKAPVAKPAVVKAKPATAKAPSAKPAAKAGIVTKAAPKPDARPASESAAKVDTVAPAPKARKSGRADDLKKIDGIGPKLEQVLQGRGITLFAHLADMDDAALDALDREIGLDGRIIRDDWQGQARKLTGGKARSGK